ncbi:MAG: ADP-ribosylglycohydrolase family protein [Prevotella sp.]|nr:ADP-ribosylglycohydrolase family protein [Prevotella sp.]
MKMTEQEMDKRYETLAKGKVQPMSMDFRDKCKGAIFGTIVGDAMFAPIEFSTKLGHKWVDKMEGGGAWGLPVGYYTDDSSMMLCIMQGYLDDKNDYLRSIAKAFCKWWHEGLWSSNGCCFDIGGSCSAGLRAFERTGSLVNGGEFSRGCGGIMRFASSWMVGYKVGLTSHERYDVMLGINNIDHFNCECIRALKKLACVYDSHLIDNRRTSIKSDYKDWREATGGFDAYSCMEKALWAFNSTNNFRDAVIASGNVGGDADSVAAVAGGIAGSYYGYKAIPRDWLGDIHEFTKLNAFVDKFLDATIG